MTTGASGAERQDAAAASAGRGVLWTMGAKVVFLGAGLGTQLVLPRVLGDPEAWGRYATVAAIAAIATNTLVASTVLTVSKRTSEHGADAGHAQREGLAIGAVLAVLLGGGFAAAAPLLAGAWQRDATLTPLLATAAIVVASYAVYAAAIGSLNGRRLFAAQARFDMGFALLRSAMILGGAALGAAAGAIAGFAGAAVIVTIVALLVVGPGARRRGAAIDWRAWLAFFVPVAIYQASLNGVLQIDQPLLRASLADLALDAGRGAEEASEIASRWAGFYRAAQTFAFVPYQLILSVTLVVFPTVSRSTSSGDAEATRTAIRGAMRFSLVVLLAMAAPIAGASDGVMRIAYPEPYLDGAPALAVLAPALVPFSLFAIAAAILAGAGRARTTAGIALGALAVVVVLNVIAVRSVATEHAIVAAALATGAGSLVALLAAGATVQRLFGAFLSPLSAARALAAAGAGYGVARVVPHASAIGAIGACAAGALAYLAALVLSRELGSADLALLRRVLRPRG